MPVCVKIESYGYVGQKANSQSIDKKRLWERYEEKKLLRILRKN